MQQLELPLGVGRTDAPVRHERYWHWLIGASPVPLLAAALLLGSVEDRPGRETDRPSSLDNGAVASLIDPGATAPSDESPGHAKVSADGESVHDRVQIMIESGDSLERVFRRRGLSLEDLGAMASVVGQIKPTRIRRIIRSRLRLGWSHYFVFADRRRPADATAVG